MRILLIEDDSASAQSAKPALKAEGFEVYRTDCGKEGLELGKLFQYDVILVDVSPPNAFDIFRSLRAFKPKTPLLILSANPRIDETPESFGITAADYLIKPIQKNELTARVHAIVARRSNGHPPSVVTLGDLTINLDEKRVEVAG